MDSSQNILVYRLGSLGDTVLAMPSFRLIRQTFPRSKITILTNLPVHEKAAPVESVLQNTGLFDDVIKYRLGMPSFREFRQLRAQIKKRRFDLLVFLAQPRGLTKSIRDWFFFRSCGISKIIGVPLRKKDLECTRLPGTEYYRWEAERLAGCLQRLGTIDLSDQKWWDLRLDSVEMEKGENLLHEFHVGSRYVVASVGTKVEVKDWGEDKWASLFSEVSKRVEGFDLVFVGSADEKEESERISSHWGNRTANLCGMTTPRECAAIIGGAALFIGHDSGPMHLAGAVGTPCVAIFSARNLPGQWYPRGDHNTVFYNKTHCFGCQLDQCTLFNKWCITSISVKEVGNAVFQQLYAAQQ